MRNIDKIYRVYTRMSPFMCPNTVVVVRGFGL